jgi:hypothetical protein
MHSTLSLISYCVLSAIVSVIAVMIYQSKQIRMLKHLYLDLCLLYEDTNQCWKEGAIAALANINDRVENPHYKLQDHELSGQLAEDLLDWQKRWLERTSSNDKLLRGVGIVISKDDLFRPI